MKRILILGAGLVSRPMVRYLLEVPEFEVTVASRTKSKAQELVAGNPRGHAVALLADDDAALGALVKDHDLAVSLLPYTLHVTVAEHCLKHRKPLVTTSYVGDPMRALDARARQAGVILLNEIGLDPGIDHMSAMQIIERVKKNGGRVTSFMSYCGGLPAPEANDNPLGYKFSWSPRGVVMAGRNDGRYLRDGKEVFVLGAELFGHRWRLDVEATGVFDAYPNRNSMPYLALYGLEDAKTMFRGTLRNPGWCETLKAVADLGLLNDAPRADLAGLACSAWLRGYVPGQSDLRRDVAARLGLDEKHAILERFAWLGFFSDEPVGIDKGSDLDVLAKLMLDRMAYRPGERDMIVLHHDFEVEYPGQDETQRHQEHKGEESRTPVRRERILSTLVDFGIPYGDSAMARTVSLPAAVAVKLILTDKITLTGVHIPVLPEIYDPVLAELAGLGVAFREKTLPAER